MIHYHCLFPKRYYIISWASFGQLWVNTHFCVNHNWPIPEVFFGLLNHWIDIKTLLVDKKVTALFFLGTYEHDMIALLTKVISICIINLYWLVVSLTEAQFCPILDKKKTSLEDSFWCWAISQGTAYNFWYQLEPTPYFLHLFVDGIIHVFYFFTKRAACNLRYTSLNFILSSRLKSDWRIIFSFTDYCWLRFVLFQPYKIVLVPTARFWVYAWYNLSFGGLIETFDSMS